MFTLEVERRRGRMDFCWTWTLGEKEWGRKLGSSGRNLDIADMITLY